MQDVINTLLLICAALASLALGVMLAYGLCRTAFAVFRMHAKSVAVRKAAMVRVS
jgi:hypothetical protein